MTARKKKTSTLPVTKPKYFQSFGGYVIPFRPEKEVRFAETEGLTAWCIVEEDADGRVARFTKVLLVAEGRSRKSKVPESGRATYYEVCRKNGKAEPGAMIAYEETENMPEFFACEIDDESGDAHVTRYRKEYPFSDSYRYWPNGKLRERISLRDDGRTKTWRYDEKGREETSDSETELTTQQI